MAEQKKDPTNELNTDRVVEAATSTLYAALGAADFIVAKATERYEAAVEDARVRRERREAQAAEMRRRVVGLPEQARTLPDQAKHFPDEARAQLERWLAEAGEVYEDLQKRGKAAYTKARGQASDLADDVSQSARDAGEKVAETTEPARTGARRTAERAQNLAEEGDPLPRRSAAKTTTTPRARKTSDARPAASSPTPGTATPGPAARRGGATKKSTAAKPTAGTSASRSAPGSSSPSGTLSSARKSPAKKSPARKTTAKKAPSARAAATDPATASRPADQGPGTGTTGPSPAPASDPSPGSTGAGTGS